MLRKLPKMCRICVPLTAFTPAWDARVKVADTNPIAAYDAEPLRQVGCR
jgi:hypothetical protein